jgi:hypothetical protein
MCASRRSPEACEGLIERARDLSPEFGARCGGVYVPPPPPPFDPCPDACAHAIVCSFGEIDGEGGLCPNDISDGNRESLMSSCLWSCGLGDGNGAEGFGPEVPCEEVVAHLRETVEPFSIICGR